jgi:hypothetical protein
MSAAHAVLVPPVLGVLVLRTANKVPVHTLMCLALQSKRGRRICAGLH